MYRKEGYVISQWEPFGAQLSNPWRRTRLPESGRSLSKARKVSVPQAGLVADTRMVTGRHTFEALSGVSKE